MSPWTNYTFRVIARNKVGDSLPSGHSKDCLTPEDVPYKNPDNVMGRGTAPNNLVISWTVSLHLEGVFLSFFVSSLLRSGNVILLLSYLTGGGEGIPM